MEPDTPAGAEPATFPADRDAVPVTPNLLGIIIPWDLSPQGKEGSGNKAKGHQLLSSKTFTEKVKRFPQRLVHHLFCALQKSFLGLPWWSSG